MQAAKWQYDDDMTAARAAFAEAPIVATPTFVTVDDVPGYPLVWHTDFP